MGYLERRREAYGDQNLVLEGVRSVVVVALDYRTDEPAPRQPGYGRVSRYAWGREDYHSVIRKKLKQVAAALHDEVPDCKTRGVVDTAPVLERDAARRAGLGWFGKNTMLISKYRGSYFFLGALLTDVDLEPDEPHESSHCGTCTACLDACPTDAFVEPYVLDARRCISYLTIELRDGDVEQPLRSQLDGWVFGCDVCQEVCPWNSKAPVSDEHAFLPTNSELPGLLSLKEIASMDEAAFRQRFAGTPLERTGLAALQRSARYVAEQEHSG